MFSSIRWRLVGSYFLLTLITTLILGVAFLSILGNYFLRQERAHLVQNAEAVALRLAPLWVAQGPDQLGPLVSAYGLLSQARIRVLDAKQRPLLDSWRHQDGGAFGLSPLGAWQEDSPIEVGFNRASTSSTHQRTSIILDMKSPWGSYILEESPTQVPPDEGANARGTPVPPKLVVRVPVQSPSGVLGHIELSRDVTRGQQLLQTIRKALLWAGLAALVVALGMGLVISNSLTAPLQALASAAKAMGQGDLRARAPARHRDEIGQVAHQFNRMAGNLEEAFAALAADRDALRRFAADASHELRTPITALKTFNELLQGSAHDDLKARQEFLQESQTQIERLDWLTENLLQLSRLDSGLLKMEPEEHSLFDLVDGVVASYLIQAKEKGVDLVTELLTEDVQARYDRQWMEQVLSNLLSNALKFTSSGGRVILGITLLADSAEIWVEDTGVGISPEDLPHIFDRFYRAKENTETGSGLGLAIAQSIVQAHNSQIRVDSTPGKGSRFWFRLPLVPTDAQA